MNNVDEDNGRLLALLSNYLNFHSDYIKPEDIKLLVNSKISEELAFSLILAEGFNLDIEKNKKDQAFYNNYFKHIFHKLNTKEFTENAYYKNIKFPQIKLGDVEFSFRTYKPYEGFVCDDIIEMPDGRLLPRIGFFSEEFKYPIILEKNIEWMTITPNEIKTLANPINEAFGNVLTYGLGLGYYPYMISSRPEVKNIDIVEKNSKTIDIFRRYILPQFPNKEKIHLINGNALEYMHTIGDGQYNFIFADLWHDAGDGKILYKKIKEFEKIYPQTVFSYWLEKTIKCYLPH